MVLNQVTGRSFVPPPSLPLLSLPTLCECVCGGGAGDMCHGGMGSHWLLGGQFSPSTLFGAGSSLLACTLLGTPLSLPPISSRSIGVTDVGCCVQLYVGSRDLNLDPSVCAAGTLLVEPPAPSTCFKRCLSHPVLSLL